MRLYLKDGAQNEFTGIKFLVVNNSIELGGVLSLTYRDPLMANIAIVKRYMNQRVEVKKNDGSTVLWEGVINHALFNVQTQKWLISGFTTTRLLAETGCNYNGFLGSGIITDINSDDTPPTITDSNQTFNSDLVTSFAVFSDDSIPDLETIWPNSDTAFVNGGIAAETTDGSYTDLNDASTSMHTHDSNDRALDYYGIEVVWTVPNQGTSTRIVITLDCQFEPRGDYLENGTDAPIVQIYDFNGTAWVTADNGDVTGLGRTTGGWNMWGGSLNTRHTRILTIDSNIGNYFDGSNKCKIRVLMGQTGDGSDTVRIFIARLDNSYSVLFAAGKIGYQIDDATNSVLTFTGQTPYAKGLRINDTFKIGDLLQVVAANIFLYGLVNWVTLSMGTSALIDCTDLRGSYILPILKRYAEQQNWRIWDKIGWIVKVDAPSESTSLSLTEANFPRWTFDADGKDTTRSAITGGGGRYEQTNPTTTKYVPRFGDKVVVDDLFATQANAASSGSFYIAKTEDIKHSFVGTIDMDDGTNYSAIELAKLITITIYTDKHVFTAKEIDKISYEQDAGGHLYCTITVIE